MDIQGLKQAWATGQLEGMALSPEESQRRMMMPDEAFVAEISANPQLQGILQQQMPPGPPPGQDPMGMQPGPPASPAGAPGGISMPTGEPMMPPRPRDPMVPVRPPLGPPSRAKRDYFMR